MTPLVIININGHGNDLGLVLNDELIMTVDTAVGESPFDLNHVADNLVRALSLDAIVTTNYAISSDDWDWTQVLEEFKALGLEVVKDDV